MPQRALQIRDPDGTVTTRWKLSFSERFQILFSGTIWLQVLTFNRRFKPVKLMTQEPVSRRTLLLVQEAVDDANDRYSATGTNTLAATKKRDGVNPYQSNRVAN